MTLLYTLTIVGWLWWWLLTVGDTRVTLGRGGPILLLAGWAVAAALLARAARRHLGDAVRPWTRVLAGIAATLRVVDWLFDAADVGGGPGPVIGTGLLIGAGCALIALVLEGLVRPLARRLGLERSVRASLSPQAVVRALVPLLLPATALLALVVSPKGAVWPERLTPVGSAGILYAALLPMLFPAALLAAWGLDGAFGRRRAWPGGLVATAAAVALLTWPCVGPGVLWTLQGRPELATPLERGLGGLAAQLSPSGVNNMRGFGWFNTSVGMPADGTWRALPMPLDGLFVGAGALALLSAALTLAFLGQARRGVTPSLKSVAALAACGFALALGGAAILGPAGAPWGASAAALLWLGASGWRLLPGVRAAPAVVTPSVAPTDADPPSDCTLVARAPA